MCTLFTLRILRKEMTQCLQPAIAGGYALKFCYDNRPWYWGQRKTALSQWAILQRPVATCINTSHRLSSNCVSHVIALFASIFCVRTLYSHPTPILVPSGKDAMQQTTKQNSLRYLNMSAWLPHLKHSFPKQEDLVYLQEWKLLTNASLSYLLFLLLEVMKDGD